MEHFELFKYEKNCDVTGSNCLRLDQDRNELQFDATKYNELLPKWSVSR